MLAQHKEVSDKHAAATAEAVALSKAAFAGEALTNKNLQNDLLGKYAGKMSEVHNLAKQMKEVAHQALAVPKEERYPKGFKGSKRGIKKGGPVEKAISKGEEFLNSVIAKVPGETAPENPKASYKETKTGRAYHQGEYGKRGEFQYASKIYLHSDNAGTAVHEWGHGLEWQVPEIGKASREFLAARTKGESLKPMSEFGRGYKADEVGYDDKFHLAFGDRSGRYVGKYYSHGSTEIMSMGLEKLYNDPIGFAQKDPEYFDFVVGVAHGRRRGG